MDLQKDSGMKSLFRLAALDEGTEFQKKYYCRIKDLRTGDAFDPAASFTIEIVERKNKGVDRVVETFSGLTMKENSPNYIAKRIGTANYGWSASNQRYEQLDGGDGQYPNLSAFVRVEMGGNTTASDIILETDLPMGMLGPQRFPTQTLTHTVMQSTVDDILDYYQGGSAIGYGNAEDRAISGSETTTTHLMIEYPTFKLTEYNANAGGNFLASDYFGLWHKKQSELKTNDSIGDVAIRRKAFDPHIVNGGSRVSCSYEFTLEDVVSSSVNTNLYYWYSGSYDRADGTAPLAFSFGLTGSGDSLLTGRKIRQFSAPFFGGADGINILKADPFSNKQLSSVDKYPAYTVNQAIEMCADAEQVQFELAAMPGIINSTQVKNLVDTVELRGDALAIVDNGGIYRPTWDTEASADDVDINRATNYVGADNSVPRSSYAATYFPNVWLKDTLNGNNSVIQAPPSVAGIGAIAKSEKLSHPWFAPAGFNRGGISYLGGALGPIVTGTPMHLTRDNRDTLYASNINPIARFPATGDTVIFGQKTLLQGTSALNRINVRRLMIYLKRQIGVIADTILFDPNVQVTWNRFKARATSVLSEVKADLGITDYKVILDESTTDADAIDQNIMYAQILVKPARAIEYIVVDFIITRSGVEF